MAVKLLVGVVSREKAVSPKRLVTWPGMKQSHMSTSLLSCMVAC